MPKEGKISMSEFKMVVEGFESKLKSISEGISHLHFKMDKGFHSLAEQVALLHESQTEIKHDLKQKIDRNELANTNMRLSHLEKKAL